MTKNDIDLTDAEREISDLVTELVVDEHMHLEDAVEHAITALPHPRPEFVLWASDGTVALVGSQTHRVADLDT